MSNSAPLAATTDAVIAAFPRSEDPPVEMEQAATPSSSSTAPVPVVGAEATGAGESGQLLVDGAILASSSSAPTPLAGSTGEGKEVERGEATASTQEQTATTVSTRRGAPPLPIELDAVPRTSRLSVAGSVPGIAVRAMGSLVGFAGFGVGYGMAKLMSGQDSRPGDLSQSSSFKMGCEAFLYANGIVPTIICEHDDQGYHVGPLPEHSEDRTELFRSTPLLVANHVSYLDAIILPIVCDMPKFMSMAEVKNWPLFGPLGQDLDFLWVDRKSPEARKKALEAIQGHVRAWRPGERSLLIFPEGTTSNGRGLNAFKKGAFTEGAPVRPVVVKYTGSWNPANVNFQEAETPEEGTQQATASDGQYVPYDDGDWALQFAGHLVHSCTVLVCRTYYPSEEEKADADLYAANVRQFMLKRLQELHVTCAGASSSSNLDERLLAIRRRARMSKLLAQGGEANASTVKKETTLQLVKDNVLDRSLWRSPSASRVRSSRTSLSLRRRSSSCAPGMGASTSAPESPPASPVTPAREKLRQRTDARRSRRDSQRGSFMPSFSPVMTPTMEPVSEVPSFGVPPGAAAETDAPPEVSKADRLGPIVASAVEPASESSNAAGPVSEIAAVMELSS